MDFVIRDSHRRVLLCLRQHEPAKNCFFVPGGRIRKNETLAQAFERILEAETGCRAAIVDAEFMGVYQHFYPTKDSNARDTERTMSYWPTRSH